MLVGMSTSCRETVTSERNRSKVSDGDSIVTVIVVTVIMVMVIVVRVIVVWVIVVRVILV